MQAELVWAALSASACLKGSASAFSACLTRESPSWRRASTSSASHGREAALFSSWRMVPMSAVSRLLRAISVVALGTPLMRTSTVAWSRSRAGTSLARSSWPPRWAIVPRSSYPKRFMRRWPCFPAHARIASAAFPRLLTVFPSMLAVRHRRWCPPFGLLPPVSGAGRRLLHWRLFVRRVWCGLRQSCCGCRLAATLARIDRPVA